MFFSSTRRGRVRTGALVLAAWLAVPAHAAAEDLVYQPRNPSFGGNPFNSDHLIGLAERQNRYQDDGLPSPLRQDDDPLDDLVRNLESRITNAIAEEAADAILGTDGDTGDSGRLVFGDQVIEYERGAEAIRLVVIDQAAGTQTEISLPILQVD